MSLSAFRYRALESSGKIASGIIRATDEQDAYRRLAAAGLTPTKFSPVKERKPLFSGQRVSSADVADLTRELNVLVEARIPLVRGLASIAEHGDKPAVTALVRDLAAQIEAGEPFTQALSKHTDVFGDVYIETVRAAEKSGNLTGVMGHLAELLERQIETRRQLRRALSYPVIVLCVVAGALAIILGWVVPKFGATFASQGVKLPAITRFVQALGASIANYWWIYAGVLAAAIASIAFAWKTPSGRQWLELFLIRIPYVGRLIIAVTAARFARIISISLDAGLDLIESIQIAGKSTGRPVFIQQCNEISDALRRGEDLRTALGETPYLPSFARRMLQAGKDSKEMAGTCNVVARHYERESSHLTANFNSVLEPLLTVFLAVIVLVVALSVLLPMWQMVRLQR